LADLRDATRLALRRGLEHPLAADERIAETRDAARRLLEAGGSDAAAADARPDRFPVAGFRRARAAQSTWPAGPPTRGGAGGLEREVFEHGPDRDGLFAAIVVTLGRLGLAIQQARALDGPGGTVFDSFQVLPADARADADPDAVARKLGAVLAGPLDGVRPARRTQPRHLRHFRIAPQVEFAASGDGASTVLSLVCTDR